MTGAINFAALMRPRSIAVIGVTQRPDTWGNWITRKLLAEAYPGTVYPINPRAQTILAYCADDPETQALCLYIEGLRDGRGFLDVARRITPPKPMVVSKAGRPSDGRRAWLENQVIHDLIAEGMRFQHRLERCRSRAGCPVRPRQEAWRGLNRC